MTLPPARTTVSFVPMALACGLVHVCIRYTPGDTPDINIRGCLPAHPEAMDLIVQHISDNYDDVLVTLNEHHAEITA